MGLGEILLDHGLDVTGRDAVEVENVSNWNAEGRFGIVHHWVKIKNPAGVSSRPG
jgi:hypothetical protein